MSDIVIKVSDLSKRYRLGYREKRSDTLMGKISDIVKAPVRNFRKLRSMAKFDSEESNVHWALKDINFEIAKGDVVGIIGHNGAGKSTLLKILSRITPPSLGEIEITGRVSSLLEVGTGFHPELTGRDNIYMNGTIHGMSRKEISSKLNEIIEFSGVEKYIDTPVKFYSSGMKVRLGFAVAAHLESEILIIDEVLAVGDAAFQKKCLGKMKDVAQNGRTVLFVSHDMGAVKNLCPESIILKGGRIFDRDESETAILKYMDDVTHNSHQVNTTNEWVDINELTCQGVKITGKHLLRKNENISFGISVLNKKETKDITFGFDIFNGLGTKILHLRSDGSNKYALKEGANLLEVTFEHIPLLSGTYHINGWIAEYKGKRIWEGQDIILIEQLPENTFLDKQAHIKNALLVPNATFSVQ